MITAWTNKQQIIASYRKDGQRSTRVLGPAEYAAFARERVHLLGAHTVVEDHPGWFKGLYRDYDSRKAALAMQGPLLFEADVTPVRRFMSDHACVLDPPVRGFLDIETDSRVRIEAAIEGGARVLCWVLNGQDGRVDERLLEDDNDEAEAELLEAFWASLDPYDQICAWNGDNFDFPVMDKRTRALMRYRKFEAYWEHNRRILWLDQLAAYKRLNNAAKSGDEKTSMALQAVGMATVGEGKNDFDSRHTWGAWVAGGKSRQDMLAYCRQDTALLPKIEDKTNFLDLFQNMCELTTALPNSHGLKPSAQFDAMLLRKAALEKTHLPSKQENVAETYEGAFVFPTTIIGIARTVHVCDFASLYPSIARTWNMGHETKGQIGCIAPPTGVTFGTDEPSMLARIFTEAMSERGVWKKKKNAATPGTPAWKHADRMSTAWKVFTNSGYGVLGNPFFRLYDRDIVESITLCGQWLLKKTAEAAEQRGWKPVAGDTDSLFIQGCTVEEFGAFVKWCNAELYPKILEEVGCNPAQSAIKLSYEKCFDRIIAPQGGDGDPAQKRYAGSYLLYEGEPAFRVRRPGEEYNEDEHSEPEIKGLEYKRGDSLRIARRLQEDIILSILSGQEDPAFYEEWMRQEREKFMTRVFTVEEIEKTSAISQDLAAYKTSGPHVRVAREMAEAGEDVSPGTRVGYIVLDGSVSPAKVISSTQYTGAFDRHHYWDKMVYPPTMRVLAGAFPMRSWKRWRAGKKPKVLPGQLSLLG